MSNDRVQKLITAKEAACKAVGVELRRMYPDHSSVLVKLNFHQTTWTRATVVGCPLGDRAGFVYVELAGAKPNSRQRVRAIHFTDIKKS